MTIEEFKKIPVRETCHLAMEHEYTTTYASEDGRIGVCVHVPRDPISGEPKGRSYRHYMIDGKVIKSKKKLIEAIKQYGEYRSDTEQIE